MSLLQRAKKKGNKFLNPVPTAVGGFRTIFKVLPLYFSNREETEPKHQLGPFHTDTNVYNSPPASGLRITWFGHSSSLLEIDGFRILIDPVWEQRASPLQWFGPKRFFAPTLRLEDLPELDAVLISHDHYDHLGAHTIRQLSQLPSTRRSAWITSLGVAKRLRGFGVPAERIAELDWTQTAEIPGPELGTPLKITSWPARHFSGRSIFDRFTTLWASFVLEGPKHRVYFGADSGLWDGFADIAAQYDHFDLTMLEIGAFHPLWANIHLGPDNAAKAFQSMGGKAQAGLLMPIHWGLFNLALHGWKQPIERLLEVSDTSDLLLAVPGEPIEINGTNAPSKAWWKA